MGEFFQGRVRRPSYLLRQDEDGSGARMEWGQGWSMGEGLSQRHVNQSRD